MTTSHSDDEVRPLLHVGPKPEREPYHPAFDDVMIDIETMSLHPHKALILSLGMIEFDPTKVEGLLVGARLRLVPDLPSQLLARRRVDGGTQKFWSEQPPEAAEHWLRASEHVEPGEALRQVKHFCAGKKRVWANGTQFDLSNLVGLGEDFGVQDLWHYQAPRDMRTFVKETPQTRIVPIDDADIQGAAHEPVYDCIVQAWQVWAHWEEFLR